MFGWLGCLNYFVFVCDLDGFLLAYLLCKVAVILDLLLFKFRFVWFTVMCVCGCGFGVLICLSVYC